MGNPELRDLEPIVSRALKRRPEDRYPSVADMAADLDAALSGELESPQPARRTTMAPSVWSCSPFDAPARSGHWGIAGRRSRVAHGAPFESP